ncbi:endonuclease domain-containing protein [Fibrivirga algicola]|uniref:Endonuclease domain-containing protein n=1 Tax=Fibrivirga algicola TaxID=2950420 RepID=A0ABX0QJ06_9BACT|nr:endonuclease domain-containing protein [Fibrivirga algicola]NID11813.1 endonuclease domain-containing protein [Fibrivirga algicola]
MSNDLFNRTSVKELRRELRQRQTLAEVLLWNELRNRQLNGMKARRRHSIGGYVVDFYCAEAALVVELDGSVHDSSEAQAYDREREAVICDLGLSMMRFRNDDVERRLPYVLEQIAEHLNLKLPLLYRQTGVDKTNASRS